MKINIETGIHLKAILIYIVVAAICGVMIMYIYNLRQETNIQRQNIEQYHQKLALTNEFVFAVNQAQAEANQYIVSRKASQWSSYRQKIREVQLLADSLRKMAAQDSILSEIDMLLRKKGNIVSELGKMFENQIPVDSIGKRLKSIGPSLLKDTIVMTTIEKDTVVHRTPKQGFWKRLANVFSPGHIPDSIVKISIRQIDTLRMPEIRTEVISDMSMIAEEASKNYADQLSAIESQLNILIVNDQSISSQITGLLYQLSLRSVNATLVEARKSAELISQSYTISIIVGGISLILILAFILMIISDVNKGKKARKALEEANARTRQILESRHQLLLSVSHDIKTPLNSILGYIELWRREEMIQQKAPLRSMQNSGQHIMSLLRNLLEFSSLEQGSLVPACSNFNLRQLCDEIAEMFELPAQQKNLALMCYFDIDEHCNVYSDALKIKQIVINLLSNSVKYTSEGIITFRMTYNNEKICFSINDTGAGIPADQMDALFKPFVRVDANKALAPGSGLGMFVVKGLVELLNGTIDVRSVVDEGTHIIVTIPAINVVVKQIASKSAKKILLADDDPALLVVLTDMLVRLGHMADKFEPSTCNTSFDEYDLVLTDLEMGNISGVDILRMIRDTGNAITIVVMTGRSDYSETEAMETGFDGYLPKPVTMQSLERLIGTDFSDKAAKPNDSPATNGSTLLEEMFDGDRQAIAKVLEVFANTTQDNIQALHQAVSDNSFKQAQALCHKMLPMFIQVDAPANCIEFLKRMDAARNDSPEQHPYWRGKTTDFIFATKKMLKK